MRAFKIGQLLREYSDKYCNSDHHPKIPQRAELIRRNGVLIPDIRQCVLYRLLSRVRGKSGEILDQGETTSETGVPGIEAEGQCGSAVGSRRTDEGHYED